jgi:hypothetical protein
MSAGLDTQNEPKEKYGYQWFYVVDVEGYAYLVPFLKKGEGRVFLKTIYPSRKHTKQYLKQLEQRRKKDG